MNRLFAFVVLFAMVVSAGCGRSGSSKVVPPGAVAGAQSGVRHVKGAPASFGIVQTTTNYNSNAPTVTMTWGSRPAAGHLLIAAVRWNNSSGGSVSATGWTQLDKTSSQVVDGYVLYKIAGSNEPTSVTFTCSKTSGYPTATGTEISGASMTAPFNRHSIAGTSPGTSYTSPSLTPTMNGTLPIVIVDTGDQAQTPQTPSGWTQLYSDSSGKTAAYESNTVTTGTSSAVTTTIGTSGTSQYSSFIWEGLINAAQPVPGAVVQSSTNSSTNQPNVTLTWSQAPKSGNLLIAVVRWNAPGTVSSSGWTALDTKTGQDVNGYILYRIAGANEPTSVTFTTSTNHGYPLATGMEITGINASAPFNQHAIAGNSPSSSYTSPSLTPTVDGTLPIAVFDTGDGNGATLQAPTGWSNVYTDTQGVTGAFVNPVTSSSLSPISVTVTANGTLSGYSSFSWSALLNPASSGCGGAVLNNTDSFPAGCQFYSSASPWRTRVASNPSYLSNSATIIAHMLNGRNGIAQLTTSKINNPNDNSQDWAQPYYVGSSSDPAVTVHCTASWGCGSLEGAVVHIPANAKPEQGAWPHGDQHLIVLDVSGTSTVEYDFWNDRNARPLTNGMTFNVGSGVKGDPYNGDGFGSTDITGGTATAAGNLSLGSLIRITEFQAGLYGIGHALSMQSACSSGAHVSPARADGGLVACADGDNTNTPPMGAHYWWDEDCSTINARTLSSGAKAMLCALHVYGGFEADTNGNDSGLGISSSPESATRYISLGNFDVVTNYMVNNAPDAGYVCPAGTSNECYQFDLTSLSVSDLKTHLHILQ